MKSIFYISFFLVVSCSFQESGYLDKKYSDIFGDYHSSESYFDYQEALLEAKKQNKPLLVVFCGWGSYYTKVLETKVMSEKKNHSYIKENFILANLYVDDRTLLPEVEWGKSLRDGKWLKTIGAKNNDIQTVKFKNGTQPYIIILDDNENLILDKQSDYLDKDKMFTFLKKANKKYKKQE